MTTSTRPLVAALADLGDRTSLRVIEAVRDGHTRFTGMARSLDLSDPVLSTRLRHLNESGLLDRTCDPVRAYSLTDKSADLWPVYAAMWSWDERWLPDGDRATRIVHSSCRRPIVPAFGCGHCRAIGVTPRDTSTAVDAEVIGQIGRSRGGRSTRLAALAHVDSGAILGDGWSTTILAAALLGRRRYVEFRSALGSIAPATLSERLGRFVRAGMFTHSAEPGSGRRAEYRLTNMARDFFPVFATVNEWARSYYGDRTGLDIRHLHCGRPLLPRYTCNACNASLTLTTTRFVAG